MFLPYPNDRETGSSAAFCCALPSGCWKGLSPLSQPCNCGVSWGNKLICQQTDTAKANNFSMLIWLRLVTSQEAIQGMEHKAREKWLVQCQIKAGQDWPIIINTKPNWVVLHDLKTLKAVVLVGLGFPPAPVYKGRGGLIENSGGWPGATPINNIKMALC